MVDGDGKNRILDFAAGERILVSAERVVTFADLTITAHSNGSAIGLAGTEAVFVRGVAPDMLDASAFVFG